MANESKNYEWPALMVCLIVTFSAAAIGSQFPPDKWFQELSKPSFNPPNWIFGPVWTVLYAMMAVALWLVWRCRDGSRIRPALTAFAIQLILNAAWSWLFFGQHRLDLAMIDIVLLWIAILVTTILFWRHSGWAAMLLVPYLLWVSFASVLNGAFWRLNG